MNRRFFVKLISLASGLFGVGKVSKTAAEQPKKFHYLNWGKGPGISPFEAGVKYEGDDDAIGRIGQAIWINRLSVGDNDLFKWEESPYGGSCLPPASCWMKGIDVSNPEFQAIYADIPRIKLPNVDSFLCRVCGHHLPVGKSINFHITTDEKLVGMCDDCFWRLAT